MLSAADASCAMPAAGSVTTSIASAFDLVRQNWSAIDFRDSRPAAQVLTRIRLRVEVQTLLDMMKLPGAFALVPHVISSCNYSFLRNPPMELPDALPSLAVGAPSFDSIPKYCKTRHLRKWPICPPRTSPQLAVEQLFVAVVTTSRLVPSRGGLMAYTLRQQQVPFGLFSDAELPGVRPLPVSGQLERLVHNRSLRQSTVSFIAQKHLELLYTLANDSVEQERQQQLGLRSAPRTRWWVISDDDSFIFVGRLLSTLALIDDSEPLFVGGAKARAHLCGAGLCDFKRFVEYHGHGPIVFGFAGGTTYAFSDAGLRRVGRAIAEGRCLDANLGDIATAACARIANVTVKTLPGGWMVNDGSIAGGIAKKEKAHGLRRDADTIRHEILEHPRFTGQLVSVHKLTDRQALCWSQHGECSLRCDCMCSCATARAAEAAASRLGVNAQGNAKGALRNATRPGGCREPPSSTCDYVCPTPAALADGVVSGPVEDSALSIKRQLDETSVCHMKAGAAAPGKLTSQPARRAGNRRPTNAMSQGAGVGAAPGHSIAKAAAEQLIG